MEAMSTLSLLLKDVKHCFTFNSITLNHQLELSSKKYILIALSTLFLSQIFINVGVTINLLPSTGMTFSFLSYGGSSILTSAFIMGIILALTKN